MKSCVRLQYRSVKKQILDPRACGLVRSAHGSAIQMIPICTSTLVLLSTHGYTSKRDNSYTEIFTGLLIGGYS